MKRLLLIFPILLSGAYSSAQQGIYSDEISFNNAAGRVSNNGTFFHKYTTGQAGYEVPKDSGKKAIYFMNMLALGSNANGQINAALSSYTESDFAPGPIATNYADSAYNDRFAIALWQVDKSEIDYHIAHWNDAGYVAPTSITEWPGNGNTANGESEILAPFQDLDGDNLYEPANGEYPIIRGDNAVLSIVNDGAIVHTSGAQAIQLELHLLFYQYNSADSVINNTTFIHSRWYNRGTQTIGDFSVGSMIDFDLGNSQDDYFGTAPASNLAYVYNGDSNDENTPNNLGYGANPPAVGIVALNTALKSNVPFSAQNLGQYNNQLNGYSAQGVPYYDNNGTQTTFLYSEEGVNGWNQYTEGMPPSDVRNIVSYGTGLANDVLKPGTSFCLDLAVVYATNPGNDFFGSVTHLIEVADSVQAFYNAQNDACQSTLGIAPTQPISFELFPNPTSDFITVRGADHLPYEIHSTDGRLVASGIIDQSPLDLSRLIQGMYTITISHSSSAIISKQ